MKHLLAEIKSERRRVDGGNVGYEKQACEITPPAEDELDGLIREHVGRITTNAMSKLFGVTVGMIKSRAARLGLSLRLSADKKPTQ